MLRSQGRTRTLAGVRERDERGAVLVIATAALAVLVLVAAFAVDLGVQRVVRRDMQALADVVALDLARELDGRTRAQLASEADAARPGSALALSLARNDDTVGRDLTVVATWGSWDGTTFDTTADPPTAVRVTSTAVADFSFAPGSGPATRTAYAQSDSTACYRLGSYAAALRSGDSTLVGPLNALLGVNLDLLSYRGLANADLRLAQLVAEPRIGSESRLLSSPIAYRDLVQASIDALNREDPNANATAVRALRVLLQATTTAPALTLGSLLGVSPTDGAALEVDLDVLDLVVGSVLVADGRRALSVPNLQAGVPGVGNITQSSIGIQQGLTLACGTPGSVSSRATASQLDGTLEVPFVNLPSIGIDLGVVKGTLQTPRATGVLSVGLGQATGQLVAPPPVTCANGTAGSVDAFTVAVSTGLARYQLTSDVEVSGTVRVGTGALKVDAVVDVRVRLVMGSAAGSTQSSVPLTIPPNDTVPVTVGGDARLLGPAVPQVLSSSVSVDLPLGIGISLPALKAGIVDAVVADLTTSSGGLVRKTLQPLAANIDSMLIGPVARLLGLRLGGADVYAVDAVCASPRLAG